MKKFFANVKNWFIKHMPSKRRLIQVYAALLYNANIKGFVTGDIFTGNTKYACVPGLNCYSCPGAVGACPLGALQNALSSSDKTVPFYMLGIVALFGILLARTICGFLCPVGLGQELLYKIKTPKLKKNRITYVLSYLKYVILALLVVILPIMLSSPTFCKYICPAGTFGGAIGLLVNPTNADMFGMLGGLFTWKFALFIVIAILSIFVFRFFCRFLCPLGALYGLFNRIALMGVKLDKSKCTDCGLCVSHCKMDIRRVGDHECIECGECISVCPTQAISWKGSKIFLHPNAVEKKEEAPALNTILQTGTTTASLSEPLEEAELKPLNVLSIVPEEGPAKEVEPVAEEVAAESVATTPQPEQPAPQKSKLRGRWLEITAWSVALAFLVFVFVYFNALAPSASTEFGVGSKFPEFTVRTYDGTEEGGEFSLSEAEGKVVVLNFWATYCNPCVDELPFFNTLQEKYSDDVVVVAFHAADVTESVQNFINNPRPSQNKASWSDYSLIFAQDAQVIEQAKTTISLQELIRGDKKALPFTVVLNAEHTVTDITVGSMTYAKLESQVLKAKG